MSRIFNELHKSGFFKLFLNVSKIVFLFFLNEVLFFIVVPVVGSFTVSVLYIFITKSTMIIRK